MKKVLSIVLSLVMVLCMLPTMAFADTAAAYNDIAGETCENAVTTLSGLGVVDGYPDGSYKPEVAVKRAEAAKLIIAALGLSEEAAGTTASFTDLAGYDWAEGYLGYAEPLGILKGDGNGLYRPGDVVSYNEMAAIVIRALGYSDDALQGTFPAAHVAKAKALGAFEDVVSGGSAGADRGDVAIMIFNVLGDEIGTVDHQGYWYPSEDGDTMIERLGSVEANLENDVIVDLADARNSLVDLTSYIGVKADLHKNAKEKIIAITNIESTVLTGKLNADKSALVVDGTKYYISTTDNLDAVANGVFAAGSVDLAANTEYTIAAEVTGKTIKTVHSVITWSGNDIQWDTANIKEVAKTAPTFEAQSILPINDSKAIDYTKLMMVGAESLAAIPEDAIVTYYTADLGQGTELIKVEVSTATVTGKVEKMSTTNPVKATISGAEYIVLDNDVALGSNGTFYLNYAGEIAEFEGVTATVNYAMVLLEPAYDANVYGDAQIMKIKLLTADGDKTIFSIHKDFADDVTAAIDAAQTADPGTETAYEEALVTYELNSKNEITKIEVLDSLEDADEKLVNGYIDGLKISDKVVVFTGDDAETFAVGTLASIPANVDLTGKDVYYHAVDGVVKAIFHNATTENTVYGYVVAVDEVYNANNVEVQQITLADGSKYLTIEDYAGADIVVTDALIKLTLTDGEISAKAKATDSLDATAKITSAVVEAVEGRMVDTTKSNFVQIDANATVYKVVDGKVVVATYDDVTVDAKVHMFNTTAAVDEDDTFDIILIRA